VSRVRDAQADSGIPQQNLAREPDDNEVIMHLERDQFVASTSRPVPPAALSARATAALWTLRVFVVCVSIMVIYTFFAQLH
jgi:hypothetical protein